MYLYHHGGRLPEYSLRLWPERLGGVKGPAAFRRPGLFRNSEKKLPQHGGNLGICRPDSGTWKLHSLRGGAHHPSWRSGADQKGGQPERYVQSLRRDLPGLAGKGLRYHRRDLPEQRGSFPDGERAAEADSRGGERSGKGGVRKRHHGAPGGIYQGTGIRCGSAPGSHKGGISFRRRKCQASLCGGHPCPARAVRAA